MVPAGSPGRRLGRVRTSHVAHSTDPGGLVVGAAPGTLPKCNSEVFSLKVWFGAADVLGILHVPTATTGDTMFIHFTRDGIRDRAAAFQRTLAFLWVHAMEGDVIIIHEWVEASREVAA
jgi:hypothetical protein